MSDIFAHHWPYVTAVYALLALFVAGFAWHAYGCWRRARTSK